ncbi:MAG: AAA family ATPase [Gaiellales bacterium]|nr:AAA family ATPase [Gaiellales bacterium]
MKLAVTGKGGTGKTTLAATLALVLAEEGMRVLAVDADPDANLAGALGVAPERAAALTPVSELRDLIAERTGVTPGTLGGFFRMNPRVDDLPERLSLSVNGVRLMVMGTVKKGEGGCVCPESVLLKSLIKHLLIARDEVVILDMEAGIEHLGRGTAAGVGAMLVVVEPGARSVRTAEAVRRLAQDIGIPRLLVVLNKARPGDEERMSAVLDGFEMLGSLPFSEGVLQADLQDQVPYATAPEYVAAVRDLARELQKRVAP